MKKLLLALLVMLGLQTQAQMSLCDSIQYTIQSAQSGPSATILTLNGIANIPGMVMNWDWQACHSTLCFAASGQTVTFNQFATTDTVKLCLMTMVDINGATWTCSQCDSLVWSGFGWVLLHGNNPVGITEITNIKYDNKMYDLLGRELSVVPKGTIYIKNRKKFIR